MRRRQALKILASHEEALSRLGVGSLALFGSVARDEAAPESDVDLMVEFSRPVGMFAFLKVKEYLEQVLGRPVDLVTRAALKPQPRERILAEAISLGEGVATPH